MGVEEMSPAEHQLLVGTTSPGTLSLEMGLTSHSPLSPRSPTRLVSSSHPRTVAMLRRAESKHAPDTLVPNWAVGPWAELPYRATGTRDGRRWTGAPLAK